MVKDDVTALIEGKEADTVPPLGRNIYQRMNAVMKAVRNAAKVRMNQHMKYKFIGHDDVTDAIRDAMVEEGIVQVVSIIESKREGSAVSVKVAIAWHNMDNPSEAARVLSCGESFAVNKAGTPDDVQLGKAVSYAVKTAQLKTFMLVGDDTPDNERDHGKERVVEREDVEAEGLASEMVAQMATCKSTAELDSIGKTLDPILSRLSPSTRGRLDKAWQAAEVRLSP